MNLYRISQTTFRGYDTYDSAVVAAPDEATARNMHPSNGKPLVVRKYRAFDWPEDPESVECELLGVAVEGTEQGLIVYSFNAG